MLRQRHLIVIALAASALASDLGAQRATIDLRGAAAAPTGKLGTSELGVGAGLGATLAWRMQPHLHLYGGWDWLRFSADDAFAGVSKPDFEETGYTLGLRFEHPVRAESRLLYRVEAGGTYKHIELEDSAGDIVANTGHGLGYEVGAGLLLPMGASWHFAPMLRYRALSRDFRIGSVATPANLRYAGLELGIARRF
jgi:hypothetical protein